MTERPAGRDGSKWHSQQNRENTSNYRKYTSKCNNNTKVKTEAIQQNIKRFALYIYQSRSLARVKRRLS